MDGNEPDERGLINQAAVAFYKRVRIAAPACRRTKRRLDRLL